MHNGLATYIDFRPIQGVSWMKATCPYQIFEKGDGCYSSPKFFRLKLGISLLDMCSYYVQSVSNLTFSAKTSLGAHPDP